MDSQTLETLIIAFDAAPSGDLARVISVELLKQSQPDRVSTYLSQIETPLTDEHAKELLELLLQTSKVNLIEAGSSLLNKSSASQALLAARCTLASNNPQGASVEYLDIIQQYPDLASDALNDTFGVQPPKREGDAPRLKLVEKTGVLDLSDFVSPPEDELNFSTVVGLDLVKKQIERKIILPFKKPSMYRRFKKKIGGGVLLYGPPGCGKTLMARATAGEANAHFMNVQISDVLDMYIGESEQKLQMLFEKARDRVPAVLFFDELEALAGKREHSRNANAAQLVSQFLSELDGFAQNNQGILILASTNTPWAIDSAFLRPGRFDRMFFIPPPDKAARQAILEMELKDRPAGAVDLAKLATKTSGFSGADLSNLIEVAADEAIDESIEAGQDVPISQAHVEEALAQLHSTTTEWLTTARNYARYANDGGRYDDVLEFLTKHAKK